MVEVYQCHTGASLKRLFDKNDKNKMFIQVDDSQGEIRISGKAYIANEEGKNEYVDQFEHKAKDIISVTKSEFQGGEALVLFLKVASMYGSKKIKIIVPNLGANLNKAIGSISNYVREV